MKSISEAKQNKKSQMIFFLIFQLFANIIRVALGIDSKQLSIVRNLTL